jgi:tRNA(Arg) A34 adenosine deaminase TadA
MNRLLLLASAVLSFSSLSAQTIQPSLDDPSCDAADRKFMARAYELADSAVAHGNWPFGALLVKDGQIILENENSKITTRDETMHAETGLVRKATQKFDKATLAACTLYTSTEPCIMCCGAIGWAGIPRVVFGVTSSQSNAIFDSYLPPQPPNPAPPLECREVFARVFPFVSVKGPLMEQVGLATHQGFWSQKAHQRAHVPDKT